MRDIELESLIDKSIETIVKIEYKYSYKIIETSEANDFLVGKDINIYAENSNQIAVFLITLNIEVDKILKRLEKIDKLEYIVFDTVCSHYIEEKTESLQKEVSEYLLSKSKYMLNRFSTGYGDYPIEVNEKIVNFLNGNRLGVHLTEKKMFIPSKTICGLIAAGDKNQSFNFCRTCNITKECKYLKAGRKCFE